MNVSAKDLGTGKEQHITITASSNLSDEEIQRAVKEAAEYEAQDKRRREAVDLRNDADSFVFQTEKALKEVGDKIAQSEKETVEADIARLKEILNKTTPESMSDQDIADLKAAKEKLMNDAQSLFTKLYEKTAAQGAGPSGPEASASGGDSSQKYEGDVVDGDYKEV